jgi:hypothetical protein
VQSHHVAISAEEVLTFTSREGDLTAQVEDLSSIHLNINEDSESRVTCSTCNAALEDPTGTHDWRDQDEGDWRCPEGRHGRHAPVEDPLSWIKSASIWPDPDKESLTVAISVGDPRGAFCMTIRKADDGRIFLDVPYAKMPMSHLPLHDTLAPGTYRVGT